MDNTTEAAFLSTLSLRRATCKINTRGREKMISIHALLAESDSRTKTVAAKIGHFYPRSPCGERLFTTIITICIARFLSTLSLRRATKIGRSNQSIISISIHALLAESDLNGMLTCWHSAVFLSTLSLRRATQTHRQLPASLSDFYPRSPCGERHLNLPSKPIDKNISIHALLAESDDVFWLLYRQY